MNRLIGNKGKKRLKVWRGELFLWCLWLAKPLFRLSGKRRIYWSMIMHLVEKTSLFDANYYLEVNTDVAQNTMEPLKHYVVYGDRENRAPMPFFDPAYYRHNVKGRLSKANSLLHYAHVGRYSGFSPSPWFDLDYYQKHNKDVLRAGIDPLLHFFERGGQEGRSPCMNFDGVRYLRDNPDVAAANANPLLHYLRYGRYVSRTIQGEKSGLEGFDKLDNPIPQPSLPTEAEWMALFPRANVTQAEIDVVVPVYKGKVETLRCLHSVLKAAYDVSFELIVINDASPDKELVQKLRRLSEKYLFTLLENTKNRGFVHSANRGMTVHSERDVVLLNADTEVYDNWLDRLNEAACRSGFVGTVTPLSNNATICSYPRFLHDNPFPLELAYAELDKLTAQVNAGVDVECPTAVGFCMFVKRACLNSVGLFNESAFGKGYGEENDFCQCAIKKGWRNVIAADVFVRHWGAASFQGEKAKRVQKALETVDKLHPNYRVDVAQFIQQDPLRTVRRRLDLARLKRMKKTQNVLIICHNRGGGAERHVQEDVQRLGQMGYGVFLLRPEPGRSTHVQLRHPVAGALYNLPALLLRDTVSLQAQIAGLGITEIHIHSLVDMAMEVPDCVLALKKASGVRLEVNLHDYAVICPRINLVNGSGVYCGIPDQQACEQCLTGSVNEFQEIDIGVWRAMYKRLLYAADQVLVPDLDVSERLSHHFLEISFEVSPHELINPKQVKIRQPTLSVEERLRVVVIGAISKIKGFEVLLACARDARQRRLPLDFILMGYSMNDRLLQKVGVTITGRYMEGKAQESLKQLSPHIVWLPSIWPETYSYTFTIALLAGLPVFAFDIGAIARRLREYDPCAAKRLFDLQLAKEPIEINDRFIDFRSDCLFEDSIGSRVA
jgi:GT2 family glycosyltransferase/glycosyltransferase involved in cell wall biosynthesis